MPELRKTDATIRAQLDALDAQLVDTDAYLQLAETLDTFLARLRDSINDATTQDRQRVFRAVVREVLIAPARPSAKSVTCRGGRVRGWGRGRCGGVLWASGD